MAAILGAGVLGWFIGKHGTDENRSAATLIGLGFGPQQIWKPSQDSLKSLQQCPAAADERDLCIATVMRLGGASPDAYQYYLLTGGFLTALEGDGRVKAGTTYMPWRANSNDEQVLLGGRPPVLDVAYAIQQTMPRPLDRNETYQQLLAKTGRVSFSLWPGDERYVSQAVDADGTQHFVYLSGLHDVCHACGIGIAARIQLDVKAGVLQSGKLLGLCQGKLITKDVLNSGTPLTFHDFAGLSAGGASVTEPYLVTLPDLPICP